jgi:hypothetical protein
MHFGVRFTRSLVPTLTDDHTVANDHAADPRIRRRAMEPALSELERTRHVMLISFEGHVQRCQVSSKL